MKPDFQRQLLFELRYGKVHDESWKGKKCLCESVSFLKMNCSSNI